MRLVDGFDEFDNLDINLKLTNEENRQLVNIELAQIEELEVEEFQLLHFKEIEYEENILKQAILQSKKDMFIDIIQKLNLIKSRIQEQNAQEKFAKLEFKINQYLESINPTEQIDKELDEFIDWLCDKTMFSRYKYKDLLKSIFKKIA